MQTQAKPYMKAVAHKGCRPSACISRKGHQLRPNTSALKSRPSTGPQVVVMASVRGVLAGDIEQALHLLGVVFAVALVPALYQPHIARHDNAKANDGVEGTQAHG